MTKDEILDKLSETSKSVHSREMEHLDESDGFLDDVISLETLLASIQKNSQNAENNSRNWGLVSIITVLLFSFAILIKKYIAILLYHQRKPSRNSETAIHDNAWKYHMFCRKMVIYVNFIIFDWTKSL